MLDYKDKIAKLLNQEIDVLNYEEIYQLLETPPDQSMGDYAFPCFKLAKSYKKSPQMIAEEISSSISVDEYLEKVQNMGPYVNFFVEKSLLTEDVLSNILEQGDQYGSIDIGKNRNVIVEFSSPNIAKPFHIGHIRTTVIGNSLQKIYKFLGFNTIAVNHLGDYGTQFGKLIVAFKAWGDRNTVEANPIPELLKLYIKFHEEAEKNPEYDDEARAWFKKLEDGDQEAKELWQWIRDVSLKEFNRVYRLLNIEFDSLAGESFYSDKMPRVIKEMNKKGILTESQGAQIVDLEPYDMPPALIQKSDGSTLYITRDIAAAIYRKETYDFYKNIYVVGSQQLLHFQQWFKIVELMGYEWAEDCIHVPFGMVSLEEGTMSTRKGRVVFLEDVLKKAISSIKEIIGEKNPDLDNKDEVAKQVGVGAVVFQELAHSRIKDYLFSWDQTLSFEGETGPYVQYTHARANSLLKKGEYTPNGLNDYSLLNNPEEITLILHLQKFSNSIVAAMEKNEPSIVTRYVIELAQKFNKFYNECPILVDDQTLREARLLLVYSVKQVLKTGLGLLGIEAPEKM